MGKHLNPLEKEVLIRQFKGNDKVKLYEFCKANNISMNSFRTWARKYEAGGLEALARLDNTLPEVFPEGFVRSDENYKREILRLRIENERLKKNYALKKTPNGEQIFILLKEKSSK